MKRIPLIVFTFLIALLAAAWLAGGASAGPGSAGAPVFVPQAGAPATAGGVPAVVSYQGQVTVAGLAYTGPGYFKFAIIDTTPISHWSNDGTSVGGGQPANAVQLGVTNGLFNVLLGQGMAPLPASAFTGTERFLRVWFSTDNAAFAQLTPDRRIAAVPYALQAEEAKNAWALAGNAGTNPAAHFLGTTDAVTLTLAVSGTAALRIEPTTGTPNLIGGYAGNATGPGVDGAVIAGGGQPGTVCGDDGDPCWNRVTADFGTVSGGAANTAGFLAATVGGGYSNTASQQYAAVGGGGFNVADGFAAAVPGGAGNTAAGAFSFAAGRRAKAVHPGSFVWADSADFDFGSTAPDQFAVRAGGGVSFATGMAAVLVNGNTAWHAGNDGADSTLDADLLDGRHAGDFQVRVSGACAAGSMIRAINPDGTVICGGLPAEHADRVGSVVTMTPTLSFALVGFSLEATGAGASTTYHLTFVHELDDSSPLFFASTVQGSWLRNFTLFVDQPGTALHYLRLDADPVTGASVATATERRPGARPLETVTLEFGSPDDPVWTTTGGPMPDPEDFPLQERVGTLFLDTSVPVSVTVPVFGHDWSVSAPAGTTYPSFSPLIVTALLDGSAAQIQTWLDTGAIRPAAQLDLFAPGTTDVMATYQLKDFSITAAEQSAGGIPGELAFNRVTLDYARIRWTVGTATFCWDRNTNSAC